MSKVQSNIASFVLIGCVMTFALVSTSVEAGKQTCQDKCDTTWAPKLQACKGVAQCEDYVRVEHATCVKHCDSKE
jgi:hypothetical protein